MDESMNELARIERLDRISEITENIELDLMYVLNIDLVE